MDNSKIDWLKAGRSRDCGIRTVEQIALSLDLRMLFRVWKSKIKIADEVPILYIPVEKSGIDGACIQLAQSTATIVVFLSDGNIFLLDIRLEYKQLPRGSGSRVYWRCPQCARRSLILYFDTQMKNLVCRKCVYGGVDYRSQRQSPEQRLIKRTNSLRARLGGTRNSCERGLKRPRYMHSTTFQRLSNELAQLENEVSAFTNKRRFSIRLWAESQCGSK